MKDHRNIPFYTMALILFALLKVGFIYAETDDLLFLLKPINVVVGLLTGSDSVFVIGKGYFYGHLNIVIDKSCGGFNFWFLSFLLLTILSLRHIEGKFHKLMIIPLALLGSYIFSIGVTSSRIFVSIIIQNYTNSYLEKYQHIVHESIGIMTNLSFLMLAYFLIDKLFTFHKRNCNEKLS